MSFGALVDLNTGRISSRLDFGSPVKSVKFLPPDTASNLLLSQDQSTVKAWDLANKSTTPIRVFPVPRVRSSGRSLGLTTPKRPVFSVQ